MAQYARPGSDVAGTESTGAALGRGWTDPSWSLVDEAVADDGDYTTSPQVPVAAEYLEVALGAVSDPVVHTGHVVRYRVRKNASGGGQVDVTVGLYQGGTLIASQTDTDVGASFTAGSFTLSEGEAAAIGDYSDLRVRVVAAQVT